MGIDDLKRSRQQYKTTKGGSIMKTAKMIVVGLVSLGFLLAGAGQAISAEKYSGFLGEYPQFQADKDRKGALIYYAPGIEIKNYTKIMIYPIEIFISKDSKYKGIKPDELKEISDSFVAALINELEPDYPVVSKPGPGVLGLRFAITNVHLKKAKLRVLNFTPVGAVVRAGQAATGNNIALADATIEFEMIDLMTYKRLGAMVDRYSAEPGKKKKDETSWKKIKKVLNFYAKRFRAAMDKQHGR
jgi:hypothetical protein